MSNRTRDDLVTSIEEAEDTSLRDDFALAAVVGLLASGAAPNTVAVDAFEIAHACMAERARRDQGAEDEE